MKAIVDKDTCIECGLCVEACPEVFEMRDDNLAYAKVDVVPAGSEGAAREAASTCPVDAIKIEE
jgi:ferredoxin